MEYFSFVYSGNSRELRRYISAILKSGVASEIKKINYGQTFHFSEKSIQKSETKLLLIKTDDEKKLTDFLSKNFPQIERIVIK